MTGGWQIMVTVVGVLLMGGICAVVHHHKIQEAKVRVCSLVLLKMLDQIDQPTGLIDTEAWKQTTSQELYSQQKSNN